MFSAVPELPELAPLDIEHKPIIDRLCRATHPQTSELCFTNLFIWRRAYAAHITRVGEVVGILSLRANPEDSFLLPPLGVAVTAKHVDELLAFITALGHDGKLCRIDARTFQAIGISDERFHIAPDRANWDYVYRVRNLIELAGDKYAAKRRDLERFTRKFDFEYVPITSDLVPACQALQDLWCDEKYCDLHSSLRAEARAVKEVLGNLDTLGVTGGAITVNGRVQAFSLGELLNDNTVVIHIEKASADLRGAFQAINQQFLANAWSELEYVNREQDLGVEGLRKAKASYHPAHMVEKFIVRPK